MKVGLGQFNFTVKRPMASHNTRISFREDPDDELDFFLSTDKQAEADQPSGEKTEIDLQLGANTMKLFQRAVERPLRVGSHGLYAMINYNPKKDLFSVVADKGVRRHEILLDRSGAIIVSPESTVQDASMVSEAKGILEDIANLIKARSEG